MDTQVIKQRYGIIGNNAALNRNIEIAVQVAKTNLNVLITGENGTGKDVFSHIIHDFSARKHNQFFAVNCGALPEGTINSELFGHVKGSFTDAKADRKGYFELADKGTLFLDEVAELPLATQAQLLRVLEKGEYIKVGGEKVEHTNVRVVAATNVNLERAVQDGRFRMDLLYRLNVVEIKMPPLRDRKDDIPLLFRKFVAEFTEQNQMPLVRLTPDANQLLKDYYWAGNIRQLRNIAEQVCLIETGKEIGAEQLRHYLPDNELNRTPVLFRHASAADEVGNGVSGISATEREKLFHLLNAMRHEIDELRQEVETMKQTHPIHALSHPAAFPAEETQPIRISSGSHEAYAPAEEWRDEDRYAEVVEDPLSLEEIERVNITRALVKHQNSRKLAAQELGISERTLYRKIKQYGL